MSYIESQLQPGEQVMFRINRGKNWYHYLLTFIMNCIIMPITVSVMLYFISLLAAAFLPRVTASGSTTLDAMIPLGILLFFLGLALFIMLAVLLDLIHFFTDELALTNRRIVGRAQGQAVWSFQKVNLPLSAVDSVIAGGSFLQPILEIERKDDKPDLLIVNIGQRKEFAKKCMEAISSPS